ncbi:hypothetical protein G7Y89_g9264 [Cudoniella acicularis]|uniref:FAD-binding domain-containing protein n=1 Tax=Cudoniella acicularis TaxID=354080 RepID=A0A8H4RF05_9HELO|nr:hypothetical protein G7Y89_g9264 [Cudoniella acicularis]
MATNPLPKIAIIGAGPAGLTLASLLHKSNTQLNLTVFDLRARPSESALDEPSGSLDLHAESGQLALETCGLLPQFKALPDACSESMILADKDGLIHLEDSGDGDRPEIPRNTLTSLLLSSAPSESIKWEHKIIAVSSVATGKWKVTFLDLTNPHLGEQTEEYTLVVGADGTHSKVRPALTPIKPHFSGITCVTLTIPHLAIKYPSLNSYIGTGTFYAMGPGRATITQRGSHESARIYLMISSPASASPNIPSEPSPAINSLSALFKSPAEFKNLLLGSDEFYASFGTQVKDLISAGFSSAAEQEEVDIKPLYMLPIGFTWPHKEGLTLIGDASHTMTPFAGEGVNLGMLDALELSNAITSSASSSSDPDSAIQAFEEKMWPRSKEIAIETFKNLEIMFRDENGPEKFVNFFKSHVPPPEGEDERHEKA